MGEKINYNVLIIGAGNIGAFLDTPDSSMVMTHAHAFSKHPGTTLLGFIDIDEQKSKKASFLWRSRNFTCIEEAFKKEKVDIVAVAAPDECHFKILKELSHHPVKLIFAEKPIVKNLQDSDALLSIYSKNKIPIAVNYTRRFVPEFEEIKKNINKGVYGQYLTGTGYYGKGLVHNGSHLIDLLRYFTGEVESVTSVNKVTDYSPDDVSLSAVLTMKNTKPFFLQQVDCRHYTVFEMDMLFEKKRIRITDLGFKVSEYDVRANKIFNGYQNLTRSSVINTRLDNALYYVVENLYAHLCRGQELKCTAEEAVKTLKTCLKIQENQN